MQKSVKICRLTPNAPSLFAYNDRGQLTQTTLPDGATTQLAYDTYGNRTGQTNELGHTWTTVFDLFRRPTLLTDPLNRATVYDYTLPGSCNCNGAGIGGAYADNKPNRIVSPSGKITEFTYDAESHC